MQVHWALGRGAELPVVSGVQEPLVATLLAELEAADFPQRLVAHFDKALAAVEPL